MIGILGGTFDPVHNGHLQIASSLLQQLPFSQIQFVPCGDPVHRRPPIATAEQRCCMVEKAIAATDSLVLNRLETEPGGPSYSVDSLEMIGGQFKEPLVMILGLDAFNGFAQWRSPEVILQLANLVVCHRPGYQPNSGVFPGHRVDSTEALLRKSFGAIYFYEVEANQCSSTGIRAKMAAGETDMECLHPDVRAYIQTQHIYGPKID